MGVRMNVVTAILTLFLSFVGNMISMVLWQHYDLEGAWESYRLRHGAKLDARQRRAAEEHQR